MKLIASTCSHSQCATDIVYYTMPDTALKQGGQPFFIPEEGEPCVGRISLAARICRQGRSIAPQFAHRYYDAVTCAVSFTMQGRLQELCQASLPWDEAVGFDGAVCIGAFQTKDNMPDTFIATYSIGGLLSKQQASVAEASAATEKAPATTEEAPEETPNATAESAKRLQISRTKIDEFITAASRHFTLHQGDIILLTGKGPEFQVGTDNHIDADLNGERVLSFNVK